MARWGSATSSSSRFLELVRVEALLPYFRGQAERPEEDRAALARASATVVGAAESVTVGTYGRGRVGGVVTEPRPSQTRACAFTHSVLRMSVSLTTRKLIA